uniref:Uncharacterized protein n=1 Tax=Glycine max TaxID=3847 RepID=C6T6T2_SOYBN|nr:unknown [Glycine max]
MACSEPDACTVSGAADLVRDIDLAETRECLSILVIDVVPSSIRLETVAHSLFVNGGDSRAKNVLDSAAAKC